MNKIKTIYESLGDSYDVPDVKNSVFSGLKIMSSYCDDISVVPAHDEIHAYLKEEEYEKMTDSDIRSIFALNWRWDDEFDGFAIFV